MDERRDEAHCGPQRVGWEEMKNEDTGVCLREVEGSKIRGAPLFPSPPFHLPMA